VRSGALAGSEQVFGTVAGELLFIWKVSSFLGAYSLIICEYLFSIHICLLLLNWITVVSISILYA